MLQLLKESVSSRHAERLEQIVIALIGIEIGWSSMLSFKWPSAYYFHGRSFGDHHYPCGPYGVNFQGDSL